MRVGRKAVVATSKPRAQPKSAPAIHAPTAPATAVEPLAAPSPRTFDLRSLLDAASRIRRGPGPEASEALLPRAERDRVTALFGALPPARSAALQKLLLGVPDGAPQALLFKAIAARAARIGTDDRALDVVTRFAKLISKLPEAELLERATVLDLDSRHSTSDVDLMPMWSKRGTIRGEAPHGEDKDNDGLLQRFTATCGPTVIQMMRAQADPVLAFAINAEGRTRDATTGEVAHFQRALLEEYGGIAVGRRESYVLARLHNAFARLGLPTRALSDPNIAAVRAKYDGFPSDEDLARVKAAVIRPRDAGIGFDDFAAMLQHYVTHLTGAKYAQTSPPEGFARGQAWRHLDAVEHALRKGYDVPFGLVAPDHWMLLSDVRGRAPDRELLVSDPDGGRTDWVGEKALVDGSFADTLFHLPEPNERPYIDSFFLPQLDRP
jgi:hypothetical protein